MNKKPFIIVAGNIGAGKSTVVEKISEELGLKAYYERYDKNPYLENFYKDMKTWAFKSQLFFLKEGIKEHYSIQNSEVGSIQDRSIYEHFSVFAKDLYYNQYINETDFELLSDLYYTIIEVLTPPDLLVYLNADVNSLAKRINKRDRKMEQSINKDYLASLDNKYKSFIDSWMLSPILEINTDKKDIRTNQGLEEITNQIVEVLENL